MTAMTVLRGAELDARRSAVAAEIRRRFGWLVQVRLAGAAQPCYGCPCAVCAEDGAVGLVDVVWDTPDLPTVVVETVCLGCVVAYLEDVLRTPRLVLPVTADIGTAAEWVVVLERAA